MRCLMRLIFVIMALSLVACAHVAQHPLQEIKGNVNFDNLAVYSTEQQSPVIFVNGIAYALHEACYDNRSYIYDFENRQYSMNTEERDYLSFKEQRYYDKNLQQRQYAYFDEERLYEQYKLDRSYMMHTEERIQRGFNEQRLYSEELENRQYAMYQDTLYCVTDSAKQNIKIVRNAKDTLNEFSYFSQGEMYKAEKGIVTLN